MDAKTDIKNYLNNWTEISAKQSSTPWKENDELFFSELKTGHAWQSLPALFFRLNKLHVEIPQLSIRENIEQADQWIQTVDLIVEGVHLEVKSRNESFTSPATFPYDTILVDTCKSYDTKTKKPMAYIMISRPTGAMLALPSVKPDKWTTCLKYDRVRKIRDKFYLAPRELLRPMDVLIKAIQKASQQNQQK